MKLTPPSMTPAPERGLFNPGERKRMRWLLFAFLLVLVTFAVMLQKENQRRREEAALQQAEQSRREPELETVVVTPEIRVELLRATARDGTPEERLLIEPDVLRLAFADTRLVNDRLFEPMGGGPLLPDTVRELVGSPDPARGQLFRAHGWADQLSSYEAAGDLPAHTRGRLRLEDGGHAFFAVLGVPEGGLVEDDFVRVDGIFTEVVRREGDSPGSWIEGPLLVGPRAVSAYPRLGPVTELDPASFDEVTDDSIAEGISGQPFYPYWELVAYVRDLPENAVDWSQTPVLDRETMAALAMDGASFRAKPVRLPVSQIMDSWVQAQKDNPLRIERLTEGWIGNEQWFGPANGVIRYVSPFVRPDIRRKDEVLARGFFLKNLAYEPSKGGVAIAPFFVMQTLETYTPVEDTAWRKILMGFTGFLVLLGVLIFVLLRRDRRRSAELQEELLARRRARRRARGTP
jgi:preprotein translocase subunit YajC